jgi:pentapeptide MXKDX repeat protein
MRKILQTIMAAGVGLVLTLAVAGCGSSNTPGHDKMSGEKMGAEKMTGDKMGGDKMGSGKMDDGKQ